MVAWADMFVTDTIAALATPVGTSALAVIRASGSLAGKLALDLTGIVLEPRVAFRCDYRDLRGALLDDVLFTYFRAPRSYTGEDTIEISAHGNPFIAQKVLEDLIERGCRAAEPGEFTKRAFLNGRMDLSQAEAVMDLIHASSERALAAAHQQLKGSLGRRIAKLTDQLLVVLARVEAYIDFPDEDLPADDVDLVKKVLGEIQANLNNILATNHYGNILRDGIKTVILGKPNAGKSSILNRLVGTERALVSPEPGTTRDFIEERITVGPHLIRLIDTAGLNDDPSTLEERGIQKTWEQVSKADLVLLVADAALPLDATLAAALTNKKHLLVLNKTDLNITQPVTNEWVDAIKISALTGDGFKAMKERIVKLADDFQIDQGEEVIAINARHSMALSEAKLGLERGQERLAAGGTPELLASELRGALSALGEITGKFDNELMLDKLFATFCIGK